MSGSTFPHDPRDPRLRRCDRCGDRYMPPAFCETHKGTCLTCCDRLELPCGLRAATEVLEVLTEETKALGISMERAAKSIEAFAQVQADIDALYGPQEDRGDYVRRIDTNRLEK